MSSHSASLLLLSVLLALLLLDVVVFCKSSSSSSSSEADDDDDAQKPAELLSKEGLKKRLLRAIKRVAKINERAGGHWTAKPFDRFAKMSDAEKRRLGGSFISTKIGKLKSMAKQTTEKLKSKFENLVKNGKDVLNRRNKRATMPTCTYKTIYDARQQWPACAPIINKVQEQSKCSNCWAVATASVFSDRYCINRLRKGQAINTNLANNHFSAIDVTACCPSEGMDGCEGGFVSSALWCVQQNGIVTGTDFAAKDGCKPYPYDPKMKTNVTAAPTCEQKCTNTGWKTAYMEDRKFVSTMEYLFDDNNTMVKGQSDEQGNLFYSNEKDSPNFDENVDKNVIKIVENEIKANGPLIAHFTAYDDFLFYSSGVYKKTSNKLIGGHFLRLIGWGKQTCSDGISQDYWIAINSWNTDWGQDGFVYVAKGVNEAGIERVGFYWGTPKV